MEWLNNIKISTKLIVGFIIVAFIAGIVGFVGIKNIKKVDENYTELYENYGVSISDIANVSIFYGRIQTNLDDILLHKGSNSRNEYINKIKNYEQEVQEHLLKFEKSIQTEEGRNELSDLKILLNEYDVIKDKVINLALSGKEDEGLAIISEQSTKNLSDEINKSVDSLFELKISGGVDKSKEYSEDVNYTVTTMIIVIAMAMIVAITLGIIISRFIGKPISKLTFVTKEISNGNLDVKIISNSKDEIGMLSESMKKMGGKLNEVLKHISFAAEQVTVGSKQIADSTIALSQGATEQASAVEELTASIEEISSQIKMNAENTKKVNAIADNTKINAVKRNSEMKLMLSAMEEINVSSNKISKIIKVIDEIAFQTNILALNAAVEAARAGQYGKGFTVVAEEVRNLAARSAKAAKETTEIIEESLIKIQDGTSIANKTADALNDIVKDIEEVAGIISDISEASDEQATGISQISQGVVQISQVVQSNSATAEESAAASEELAGQAEVLKDQVQMFSLKDNNNSNFHDNSKYITNIDEDIPYRKKKDNMKHMEFSEVSLKKSDLNPKRIILSDNEFGKY